MKRIVFILSLVILICIFILLFSKKKHPYKHLFKETPYVPTLKGRKRYVNFDASASTLPFEDVCKKIEYFTKYYSNIHRGHGYLSKVSSHLFDKSRKIVLDFINAPDEKYMCIFGKNTSECINKLAYCFTSPVCKCKERDVILITEMEHHSNILPWKKNPEKIVDFIKINKQGFLDLEDLNEKIKKYGERISIISVSGGSNVTGIVNPIKEIAEIAHSVGAFICVDGAQLVPHRKINIDENDIDFLCFSGHKMYSPFGIGVLVGLRSFFNNHTPCFSGGGEVDFVDIKNNIVLWKKSEERHEEGTPNIIGVIALSEAIKILNSINMDKVHSHETELYKYAYDKLSTVPNINILSPNPEFDPLGIVSFYIGGLHQSHVGSVLEYEYGIGCRSGCLCASPYVKRLLGISDVFVKQIIQKIEDEDDKRGISGVVRISFSLYTSKEDIDYLCFALENIINGKYKSYIQNKDGSFVPETFKPELFNYDIL